MGMEDTVADARKRYTDAVVRAQAARDNGLKAADDILTSAVSRALAEHTRTVAALAGDYNEAVTQAVADRAGRVAKALRAEAAHANPAGDARD